MAKYVPPITEPRRVSQRVWVAACLGIIIFAAALAVVVPSFTGKIKQTITPPTDTASAPRKTTGALPIAIVLRASTEFQAETFGPQQVGSLIELWNPPGRYVQCLHTKVPGEDWLGIPNSHITNVDRYGNEVPLMTERRPAYIRIDKALFGYRVSTGPTCNQ
jgi:hypothetical protein